jgi:hypothetical protein
VDDMKGKYPEELYHQLLCLAKMRMWTDPCYKASDVLFTMFPIINMTLNCLNGGIGRIGRYNG